MPFHALGRMMNDGDMAGGEIEIRDKTFAGASGNATTHQARATFKKTAGTDYFINLVLNNQAAT